MIREPCFLGIDVGTESVRAVIFDTKLRSYLQYKDEGIRSWNG